MTSPAATIERLETAILLDVVMRFVNLREGTSRLSLLIKLEGQPAWQAIGNLTSRSMIRNRAFNKPTEEEEYLPTAAAFEFCGNSELRDKAKSATTVVLHTLKQMFKGERKKEGLTFEDLQRHVNDLYPNNMFDPSELKLGLYLANDFRVFSMHNSPDWEVTSFRISEAAISMANPDTEWDRVMEGIGPSRTRIAGPVEQITQWEEIKPLGGGGQSNVFLVRSPERATQRATCLQTIRVALDQHNKAELADAIWSYARPDSLPELGAKKIFKIRDDEQQAIARLKQEMQVLQQDRPGLPKLLDSNEAERWIVTEYFPEGTLEDNILRYKGKPALALKAFLSLVNTVAQLHDEDIVHRDIKPANVFVRHDDDLVLGDFGIVFLPDQPARLTRADESVGPHDFTPPWADIGGRLEKVDCNFDVYSLGKLLWCMVSGRHVLKREWFRDPQNDISVMFGHDPHAFMINEILEKCVVERPQDCVGIHTLRAMVITFVSLIQHGGQLMHKEVPRPCHVCGSGKYQPESLQQNQSVGGIRIWAGGSDTVRLSVETFTCDKCGHVEFFKAT
jgi:serine/threonine protein kinase